MEGPPCARGIHAVDYSFFCTHGVNSARGYSELVLLRPIRQQVFFLVPARQIVAIEIQRILPRSSRSLPTKTLGFALAIEMLNQPVEETFAIVFHHCRTAQPGA